jgi:hypothetical protein
LSCTPAALPLLCLPYPAPLLLPWLCTLAPRPGATATAAWPAVGDRCPSALDPTPALQVHVPLFLPLEANAEMGLRYPPGQDVPSGNFFQKIIPGKILSLDGTRAQNFSIRFSAG